MNVITKQNPTNNTSSTSYVSMMTPNVTTTNNNKRRESSVGEDSVSKKNIVWFTLLCDKNTLARWLLAYLLNQLFRSDEQLTRKSIESSSSTTTTTRDEARMCVISSAFSIFSSVYAQHDKVKSRGSLLQILSIDQ
jgi:hypothetical protein